MAAQLVVGSLLFAILASSSGHQSAIPDFRREDENVLLGLEELAQTLRRLFEDAAELGRAVMEDRHRHRLQDARRYGHRPGGQEVVLNQGCILGCAKKSLNL